MGVTGVFGPHPAPRTAPYGCGCERSMPAAMKWIDGHLDLAYLALSGRDMRSAAADDPDVGCVTLPALREGGVEIVFATVFTEPDPQSNKPWCYRSSDDVDGAEAAGLRQLSVYEELEAEGEITIVRTRTDLDRNDAPLPRVVLLMEGADPVRSPAHLAKWHERGLRMIGLTWAAGTRYAGGNSAEAHGPLSNLGRELVAVMDERGMVHDVSHLADEAFDDLLELARGPIVATHSNCRGLLNARQRHLRDDQIERIGQRGGIVGLNLFSKFITADGAATIAQAIDHVEHVASVMGHRDGVALGSDMDGGFGPGDLPQGIRPESLDRLADELSRRGWSDADVRGFAHGNWMRLLREIRR